MTIDTWQIEAAARRFKERSSTRARNIELIKCGRGLSADTPERVEKFLARRGVDPSLAAQATASSLGVERLVPTFAARESVREAAFERVLGNSNLMGISFLERGLIAARSVGRVWIGVTNGRPTGFGTGFLISPRLLMTNHHVLTDAAIARRSLVEFDYQVGLDDRPSTSVSFELLPDEFFANDRDLDYAIVAVRPRTTDGRELRAFGWSSLFEEEGKAVISQWLNIIQHPGGAPKQVALRENQLVDVLDQFLHYQTDTEPGSSGSPVFNDRWEVVALHHSGVWKVNAAGDPVTVDGAPWQPSMGEHKIHWIANEGARVSRIVKHVRGRTELGSTQMRLFDEALRDWGAESLGKSIEPRGSGTGRGTPVDAARSGFTIGGDGSATWTIPVTISVNVGGGSVGPSISGSVGPGPGGLGQVGGGAAPPPPDEPQPPPGGGHGDPQAALQEAIRRFGGRDDVLGIRLGYVFKDGWITRERAVVVTVRKVKSPTELRESGTPSMPESLLGIPIEVTSPTIGQLLKATGHPIAAEAFTGAAPIDAREITYVPPEDATLDTVTDTMRVVAHVSPDAGWSHLQPFLQRTQKRLVIGMYDFGAPHIYETIEGLASKQSFKTLSLVMQRGQSVGSGTKKDDMEDQDVVDGLTDAFGDRFENAWVQIGTVNGWVASSYHIKVAVRDGSAFWLSSGNWQSSNQPKADPLSEVPQSRTWLTKYNRDWHAIIEHKGLAKTFEAFLQHDLANNQGDIAEESLSFPTIVAPGGLAAALDPREAAKPFKYFPAFDEERTFTVTPLLTPDNYHAQALKLVRSATQRLWIQNQTFKAPNENQAPLAKLIDAVMERHDAGVDVRVIFRVITAPDAREVLEGLAGYGFPMDTVRVQKNCHTKAMIVDDTTVLLGSQNWSSHGVSLNRDASLIFEDAPLNKYFAEIVDHDWRNLAMASIGSERGRYETLADDQVPDATDQVLDWKDYMETL